MTNILQNPNEYAKYRDRTFTVNGYTMLQNYAKNLIMSYIGLHEYPRKLGMRILGLPMFTYADECKSEDELLGRIKLIGQLLGVKEFKVQIEDGRTLTFDFNGKYQIV